MIIAKTEYGYQCKVGEQYFDIQSKESYLNQKAALEAMKPPTIEEMVEMVKNIHPFYKRDVDLQNIEAQLAEIEAFENGTDV